MRAIIPDYLVFGGGAQGSFGGYLGQEVTMTLMLRRKDPGLYVNDTKTVGAISAGGLDVTLKVGPGWFATMDPRNVSSDVFGGSQISISGGVEVKPGIGGGIGTRPK